MVTTNFRVADNGESSTNAAQWVRVYGDSRGAILDLSRSLEAKNPGMLSEVILNAEETVILAKALLKVLGVKR